ncbi:cytochrome P450, partial [Trametes versicolor FP-101664 SS1]|uniref:cytochrome P450 n=1 Tax=Trametes versicolor (strain FP-101664) TaxID=717944 RepID=UPI0004622352
ALQYIHHKSGYHFPKAVFMQQISREINGDGILTATGHDHARIRKIMNPAFSAGQLRSFLPLFQCAAQDLSDKWNSLLQMRPKGGQRLDVHQWISRCSLNIIGKAAFDIDPGTLAHESLHAVAQDFKDMFTKSIPNPSVFVLLLGWVCRYLPVPLLRLMRHLPMRRYIHFRRSLDTLNEYSQKLIEEKSAALLHGTEDNKRDVMNILVRANASENPSGRLSDPEMISMMVTLLLAGNDTTTLALSWLLYELAKCPEYQEKMRAEIKAARALIIERGESAFSMSDLDAMSFVGAAIKEGLRLNPAIYALLRVTSRDEVIPLAYPIVTISGAATHEVYVPKGTELMISIQAYNRLPQVWGTDADTFNPHRFLERGKTDETFVGMTSNLMTFSAGLQGCIGWRFAIIVMQAMLVELVENFRFTLLDDQPEIVHLPAGFRVPIVEGERERGAQMPLYVCPVED